MPDIFDELDIFDTLDTGGGKEQSIKTPTWQQKYGPAIRNTLQYGGAAVGSVLGAPAALASGPAAPLVEAGAIAGGHLLGSTVADYILAPPKTAEQAVRGIASDIPEAAVVGMSGPIGGKLVGGATSLIPKVKITPEVSSKIKLSQESGVPLTVADVSGQKSHAIIESQLRRNFSSADTAQGFVQRQYAALQDFAKTIQTKAFGGASDELVAGELAQAGAKSRYKAFQRRASDLYESAPVEPATKIETETLKEIAKENLDELGKIQNGTVKRILNIVGESEQKIPTGLLDASGQSIVKTGPAYTWQELLADQSTLRKLAKSSTDYNQRRIYKGLVNAINDDIASFAEKAGDPAIKNSLDDAVKYYRQGDSNLPGVQVWRDNQIKNLMNTNSPEDIVKKFFKAYPNESDILRLKSAVGPKGFQEIKRAWLDDLLTRGEGQSFSPAKFATWYDKYRAGGNLDAMLTRKEIEGLDKLYDISRRINMAEKLAGNPSGTGQINMNDLMRWVAHPIRQTIMHFGTKKFAEMYFNDPTFRMQMMGLLERPPSPVGRNLGIGLSTGMINE